MIRIVFKPVIILFAIAVCVGLVVQSSSRPIVGEVAYGDSRIPLPNGVAAGEVTGSSVVLWARSDKPGKLKFEVSPNKDFKSKKIKVNVIVDDPLAPAKIEIQGLSSNTDYFYRVERPGQTESFGKFRTLTDAGVHKGVRFGATGDQRGELGPFVAVRNAADRDLDFFANLGDTIYADFPSPDLDSPQATTLSEFRTKHQEVYADRLGTNVLGELRSATVWRPMIDDHEVTNDFNGGAHPSTDPRFEFTTEAFINETTLYSNGLKIFQEYNPIRDEFYGAAGQPRTAGKRKLYRSWRSGDDAAFFQLDARSFRDVSLPPVDLMEPGEIVSFLIAAFAPNRTMLGAAQLAEFRADLLQAELDEVTWKFVMVPEPIQNLGLVGAQDRFEGYATERTEILEFVRDNGIKNVVFISADIHGTIVNNLSYQTAPFGEQVPIDAFEVTTGPVAFDAPLGPTVANILAAFGLLTPEEKAFYDSLPSIGKDLFIGAIIDSQVVALGYDPVGLQGSSIDATLVQGSYVAVHYYGWTEFEVDEGTQELTVTTYGSDPYTQSDIDDNPEAVLAIQPAVISRFTVRPK